MFTQFNYNVVYFEYNRIEHIKERLSMEKRFYTKKETAELLGFNPKTIERYLLSGRLAGAKIGKAWRISANDINNFYDGAKEVTAKKRNKDT